MGIMFKTIVESWRGSRPLPLFCPWKKGGGSDLKRRFVCLFVRLTLYIIFTILLTTISRFELNHTVEKRGDDMNLLLYMYFPTFGSVVVMTPHSEKYAPNCELRTPKIMTLWLVNFDYFALMLTYIKSCNLKSLHRERQFQGHFWFYTCIYKFWILELP
jgi:hypothetical protein